jgi:SH3-like domain-containing protein
VFFASRAQRIADGLREEARSASSVQGSRVVTAQRVNLRAGPSTNESVLGVLPQWTPVMPQRSEGEWVLVRTPDGIAGWVHISLLGDR